MALKTSLNSEKIKEKNFTQLLRSGIIAAMGVVNLYEQMEALAENADIKNIFLELAKETKEHIGKLNALLLREDKEQEKASEEGKRNVDAIPPAGQAAAKPFGEQKVVKPSRPEVQAEKGAIKSKEEPRPARPIESAVETGKPQTVKPMDDLIGGGVRVCSICGYKAYGPVPNKCPVCGASREAFK